MTDVTILKDYGIKIINGRAYRDLKVLIHGTNMMLPHHGDIIEYRYQAVDETDYEKEQRKLYDEGMAKGIFGE